jgi:D-glycero-alpha-D-manno-heptose-7-phosphate kinase
MIIAKTPFRISLIGGGTDFPSYYKKNGGLVIGGTIDKYCYVTARFLPKVFDYKHRIVWSKNEVVNSNKEIIHPTVKSVFNYLKIKKGLEIHYQGDLQKNSGLGTSSSFCVGLLNSIKSLHNINTSSLNLALSAIHIEQNLMKENSGSQDQIWASYGGFNSIEFNNKDKFKVKKIPLTKSKVNKLNCNLFLIYTGIHKYSHIIEGDKMLNFQKNINFLDQIHLLAKEFKSTITNNNDLDFIGDLLNEYWFLKKKLSTKVSNYKIDEIYDECIKAGATGGKIIGSGGGGFLLMYCKKQFHNSLTKRLKKLPIVNFKFVEEGSKIIFKNKD